MEELINVCFNSGNMEFTKIARCGATWTNCLQNCRLSFNKTIKLVKQLLHFLG